jgi:arabinan endo-1,5-alpha-L-arabinosidase
LTENLTISLWALLQPSLSWSGDVYNDDPSWIRSGHCYYIFSTGNNCEIRRLCNDTSVKIGAVFNTFPQWIHKFAEKATNIWAPDINYINGEYYVYYVGSSMGSRNSVIALATANNIEGPYVDRGEVCIERLKFLQRIDT